MQIGLAYFHIDILALRK